MTKTLKQLQEEHPEWCFICGTEALLPINHEGLGCYPLPMLEALTAAKREDEKRIAELEKRAEFFASLDHAWAVGMQEKNDSLQSQLTAAQATIAERERDLLVQAGRSDGKNIIIRELEAKLSAEREAHAATKEELWEAQETVQQQAWELREVDQAALARQSQRAADAAKEK